MFWGGCKLLNQFKFHLWLCKLLPANMQLLFNFMDESFKIDEYYLYGMSTADLFLNQA